ncbi:MAG: four helix bundle protein, partial [Clostridia bacterium]|nr:four helix bundle protein [Clostridia bacterium]
EFSVDIIELVKHLKSVKESIISNQIGRSGTSIGANIHEAQYAQGKKDFISKLEIALKETAETEYWIKLLQLSEYINEEMATSLLNDRLEIKRILISSINTAKENLK